MTKTAIKFCGITTAEGLHAAARFGAEYIGLMLWEKSPRALDYDRARALSAQCPESLRMVGVFVDASDDHILRTLRDTRLTMIQLHGGEDAGRVAHIRALTNLPVVKALRVATRADLKDVAPFEAVSDWLLFDTKIDPKISTLPGGTGHSFDWQILKDMNFRKPWILSGGLKLENIDRALSILQPAAVDISSGIEDSPGVKNIAKMQALAAAIKARP